jgi:hypothetical protein
MLKKYFVLLLLLAVVITGCDILGSKGDSITDEIFEEGRQDPNVIVDEIGYAALVPFWENFNQPTDVYVGYDELVYVTDAEGVHVLDRAGRRYDTLRLRGAVSVTQDRLLNVYVAARYDTVITAIDPDITWDLPAVYKFRNLNTGEPVDTVDILKHPFRRFDSSRSNTTLERFRLDRGSTTNDELVEITGIAVLSNNDIYVTRRGPSNSSTTPFPDNTVLIFDQETDGDELTGRMRNVGRINLRPSDPPNFFSGIDISDISSFIGPPQRDNPSTDRSFMITQGNADRNIPFRTLLIDAVNTPDGLEYRPNSSLQNRDTTRADSFLYDPNKFKNPSGIAFSADARSHIFVVDAVTDSLYLFQSNGVEGINPPAGSDFEKAVNVSFGGTGSGPREFDSPSGVAYFQQIVYVADKNNNRIARYRLNTDFE